VPVAANWVVAPCAIETVDGVTVIEVMVGSVKKFLQETTVSVSATKASSAGKALRFGKEIIGTLRRAALRATAPD